MKTIEELTAFLQVSAEACIKSVLFKADDRFVLVLVRGDHEVNDIKVKNLLHAEVVELATHEEVIQQLGTELCLLALSVFIRMWKYMPIKL